MSLSCGIFIVGKIAECSSNLFLYFEMGESDAVHCPSNVLPLHFSSVFANKQKGLEGKVLNYGYPSDEDLKIIENQKL